MTDIVDSATRSRMMSGIKSRDTKHEVEIRKRLHALGFRYRLYNRKLPASPDIVLPKYKAIIFIHGCFWHVHDCHLFKWPSTRTEFWRKKLLGNRDRDMRNFDSLRKSGWRIMTIWECSIKRSGKSAGNEINKIIPTIVQWLVSQRVTAEIKG